MNKSASLVQAEKILSWAIKNHQTITKACQHFGVSERNIRTMKAKYSHTSSGEDFMKMYRSLKATPEPGVITDGRKIKKPVTKFDPQTGELDAVGNKHIKSLEDLLEEAKIDLEIWTVERHLANKWDVTTRAGKVYQNWQIKAWLKRDEAVEKAKDIDVFFKDLLKLYKPVKYRPVKYSKTREQNLLEINIFDLHLGKLCWAEEVNNNYDTKIASTRFRYALTNLLKRAEGYQFERILLPIGNDFFNSDTSTYTTTLGTPQHDDCRWQKTFRIGCRLIVEAIDVLRQHAPVDIVVVPGNHDQMKSFFLGETIAAWYRNAKDITVDNRATPRKYYEYGNVLLGFTHGDKEKIEKLRSLMAYESKDAWARTVYKEFHLGHQHRKISTKHIVKSEVTHEELGILVRQLSSLSGTDAWHHSMGFLGPTRAAEGFLWNKKQGLLGQINVNIDLTETT